MWLLLVLAGLNTAITSLYYYLRVIKVMTIDPEPESRLPIGISFVPGTFVVLCTAPVLFFGIWPESLDRWARARGFAIVLTNESLNANPQRLPDPQPPVCDSLSLAGDVSDLGDAAPPARRRTLVADDPRNRRRPEGSFRAGLPS